MNQEQASTGSAHEFHRSVAKTPIRILLVEDDLGVQSIVREMCDVIGSWITVDCVTEADAAEKCLSHGYLYDLVVSDVFLAGGTTGIELWRECQQRYPKLRFIFISSMPREEFFQSMRDSIPTPCLLTKPFSFDEFAGALKEALNR